MVDHLNEFTQTLEKDTDVTTKKNKQKKKQTKKIKNKWNKLNLNTFVKTKPKEIQTFNEKSNILH